MVRFRTLVVALVTVLVVVVAALAVQRLRPEPQPEVVPGLPPDVGPIPEPTPEPDPEVLLHVDGDAGPGGDGSEESPFHRLEVALEAAEGGEGVVVHEVEDAYEWRIADVDLSPPVTIRPAEGAEPAIDVFEFSDTAGLAIHDFRLDVDPLVVRAGERWTFSGNTILGELRFQRGGSDVAIVDNRFDARDSRAILLDKRDLSFDDEYSGDPVRGVLVRGNDLSAAEDGIQAVGADDVVVEDNVFHDLAGGYHPDGIQVLEGSDWVIRRNTIRDYEWQGIILQPSRQFSEDGINRVLIENNLIHDGAGAGVIVGRNADEVVLVNNTIWDVGTEGGGGAALHYYGSASLVAFNNILEGIYEDRGDGGTQHFANNLVGENPGFAAAGNGDFGVVTGSVAVDGGLREFRGVVAPAMDRDQEVRRSMPDVGAFEIPA